jgi:ABC-type uncharacterized transport system substrate-binding protein
VDQNIAIEYRWSDQAQRLSALAVEPAGLKVDVIVAGEETTALAAKQVAKDIPIVIAVFNSDLVAAGLAHSLTGVPE